MFQGKKAIQKSLQLFKQRKFFISQKNSLFSNLKTIHKNRLISFSSENQTNKVGQSHKHEFKTETAKILNIVAHSLYTDKDVFVRELLSNASDALEKQRIKELLKEANIGDPLQINITTDEQNKQLIIQDTGIGMNEQDLIENLGTIASSGSKKFLEELEEKQLKGFNDKLIGQFGVGFYSGFIVGDFVEVITRKYGEEKAFLWRSDGKGTFEIQEVQDFHLNRGTKIIIHLKPEFVNFSKQDELKKIIDKYSNFISHPIFLNHEKVNIVDAIWAKNKNEVTEEEYKSFFEYFTKAKIKYKYFMHYSIEVPLNIKTILYIPSSNSEMFGMNSSNMEIDLYSRRVLIKKNCQDLLPNYLRFVKGVIDCEDLPLNISRENYQDSNLIIQLRKLMTKRVLKLFEQEAKKNPQEYNTWIKDFHLFFKEGLHSDHDNKDLLLSLNRFESSFGENISLDDYLANLKKEQKKIYFFLTPSKEAGKFSPFMEPYIANEIPVLYLNINIEEMIFRELKNYKGFEFVNIEAADTIIPNNLLKEEIEVNEKEKIPINDQESFSMWIRTELQPIVSNVKYSTNLKNSPAMLISQITTGMRQMLAILQPKELDSACQNMTLEINPNHEIIINLNKVRKINQKQASVNLKQVLDSCMLLSGIPFNTNLFVSRTNDFISRELKNILGEKVNQKNEVSYEIIEEEKEQLKQEQSVKNKVEIEIGEKGEPKIQQVNQFQLQIMQNLENIFQARNYSKKNQESVREQLKEVEMEQYEEFLRNKIDFYQNKKKITHLVYFFEFILEVNQELKKQKSISKLFLDFLKNLFQNKELNEKSNFYQRILRIYKKLTNFDENEFIKNFQQLVIESNFDLFDFLCKIQIDLNKNFTEEQIITKVEIQIKNFETEPKTLSRNSLLLLPKNFVQEKIIDVLKRLISKSVKNYNNVFVVIKNLKNLDENEILQNFDDILEPQLCDAITKEEELSNKAFQILNQILTNRQKYLKIEQIQTLFDKLVKNMFRMTNAKLNYNFCNLITLSDVTGYDNILSEILIQYFASLEQITEREQKNQLKKQFFSNKSLCENKEVFEIIFNNKEIQNNQQNYDFSLINLTTEKEDLKIIQLNEKQLKIEKTKNLLNSNSNLNNYNQILWGIFYGKDSFDSNQLTKFILNKKNFWFDKNLFNFISGEESLTFIKILIKFSKEIEEQSKSLDKKIIGILLYNLINKIQSFKYESKQIQFPTFLCGCLIKGMIINTKNLQEKLVPIQSQIFYFIFEQKIIGEVFKDKNLFFDFLKLISFSPKTEILNKKFYSLILSNKIEIFENYDIKQFQHYFKENRLLNQNIKDIEGDINFFSDLIFYFPDILIFFCKFFDLQILQKLTRMKTINEKIQIQAQNEILFFSHEDIQALNQFGYSFTSNEEKLKLIPKNILLESLQEQIEMHEKEDEKFQELENQNIMDKILEQYGLILIRLSQIIETFSLKFKNQLQEKHQKGLNQLNQILHQSVLKSPYLKTILRTAFEQIFNLMIISQNVELLGLASVYCYVITDQESRNVLTNVENFIAKLNQNVYLKFDFKIFTIFFDLLKYIVKYKFDVDFKQKVFTLLIQSSEKFFNEKIHLFEFINKNINELYFQQSFDFLGQVMLELGKNDETILEKALLNFLNYEQFALKLYLEKMQIFLESKEMKKQIINPFQKLKLLIMTESNYKEIALKTKEILQKFQEIAFNVNSIEQINFEQIIYDVPFDLHNTIKIVLQDFYQSLNENQKNNFIEKFLSEFMKIINTLKENQKEKEEVQERLGLFPNVLKEILNQIDVKFVIKIYQCLFQIESKNITNLTQQIFDLGIQIIQTKKELIMDLIKCFQDTIKIEQNLLGPIIFIGESAKINQEIFNQYSNLENQLVDLISKNNLAYHKKLCKYLRNLIGFFHNPRDIINNLINESIKLENPEKIQINCYFIAGMMKGLGIKSLISFQIFEKINGFLESSKKRDLRDLPIGHRYFSIYMLNSLWFVFKKLIEPQMQQIIEYLVYFFGDIKEDIRNFSKKTIDNMMKNISSYSIQKIIPVLIRGCEDKNWRTKLNSILGLAAVSYCGIKQLSENLPIIVPKLTSKINDTNEQIKEAAVNSLSLILSTIKNPEISEIREIIIQSLSDPFNENDKALDALLLIRFLHFIDGPSLSLIMPIIIYGLKNSQKSYSKERAAKIVANILSLINNDQDFWPHIESLTQAMLIAVKDVDDDVRALTSKAFKNMAIKFPALANYLLNKLKINLVDENTISIAKAGFAQAFAEILGTLQFTIVEEIFPSLLSLTIDKRIYVRESFLSVFVYIPIVFKKRYQKYVQNTMNVIIENLSSPNELIRNLGIKANKMLIQNFFEEHQKYFIDILFEKAIQEDPILRKSSLILFGDIVEIICKNEDKQKVYEEYSKVFSILYIMKNDTVPDVKTTANTVFKNYVDNTPKCLKVIYFGMIEIFIELYLKKSQHFTGVANIGLKEFAFKYGDVYLLKIIDNLIAIQNSGKLDKIYGVSVFIKYFILFFNKNHLTPNRVKNLADFLKLIFDFQEEEIWREVIKAMRFLSEITLRTGFLKKILNELVQVVDQQQIEQQKKNEENSKEEKEQNSENEEEQKKEKNSENVEEQKIEKNSENEEEIKEQIEENSQNEEENQQETVKESKQEIKETTQQEKQEIKNSEGEQIQKSEENSESQNEQSVEFEKLVELICELLLSNQIKIVNFSNNYVFQNPFKEWQISIIIVNIRVYGSLLYSMKELQDGLNLFLNFYEVIQKENS